MAQRVSLIQMPIGPLEDAVGAICGDPAQRKTFAENLAEKSVPHMRRVTVSERVAHAAEKAPGDVTEAWSFAHNCLPYLIAETQAEEICSRLRDLEKLGDERSLEDLFVQEARKLRKEPAALDREEFKVPPLQVVQQRIFNSLEKAAALRLKALAAVKSGQTIEDEGSPIGDYVGSTWIWLGRMFARTHVCFWQGRDRWLGGVAAFPGKMDIRTTVTTMGPPLSLWGRFKAWLAGKSATGTDPKLDPRLAEAIAAMQQGTRNQMGSIRLIELQSVLVSTADLSPRLDMLPWKEYLPPQGSGNLVSGAVPLERIDRLIAVLRKASSENVIPTTGKAWVELAIAAAVWAKQAGAHLVEGDDVTFGWWPILDPDGPDSAL